MHTPRASVVGSVRRPIISSESSHLLYPFDYHNSCARTMQTCNGSRSLSNSAPVQRWATVSNGAQIEPASWLAAGLAPRCRWSTQNRRPSTTQASPHGCHALAHVAMSPVLRYSRACPRKRGHGAPAFRNRNYRALPSQFGLGRIALTNPPLFPQSIVDQLVTSPVRDTAVRYHPSRRPAFLPTRFAPPIRTTNSPRQFPASWPFLQLIRFHWLV